MKKIYILLVLLGTVPIVYAQTSPEVLFGDYVSTTDNDLVNFFMGDYTL